MGVICHGQDSTNENELIRNINNNPIFLEKKTLDKIIKIQKKCRYFLSKKKLLNLKKSSKEDIFKELDTKKLIDFNKILECKSEIYYNKLIFSNKIKPFEELIKENKDIQKKLDLIKNNSFNFPFYVQDSEDKVYKGSWNFNKNYHGYGIIYEFNSKKERDSKTEGIFEDGFLNGFGRIFLSNDEMLIGEFKYNKLNGSGEYYRNDGSIYKGGFFDGLPQGNGEEIFNNGSTFTGFYLAGKKKHGKFLWKNGNFYQGDFFNDMFHGYGIYKWGGVNEGGGRTYEGNWKDGKMEGKGKLMFVDGSYYEGEFVEGKKWGKGIYVWNKEKYYDGEWKNDKQNGYGVYYKNGNKLKGYWVKGKIISNYKKANKNLVNISPENKHKTIEGAKNLSTNEGGNNNDINMISICTSPFNTIRSEIQEANLKKLKKNNTHVYISKKIKGKKFLGTVKKNNDFNNNNNINNKEENIVNNINNIK